MPDITINVRPSTGQIFQISFDPEEATVEELKVLIGEKMGNLDASSLKLVFSGRILKNEDLAMECKITAGSTVHVVRSGGNKAPASASATSTNNTTTTSPATPHSASPARQTSDPIPPIPPTPSPSTLTGLGGNSLSASPFGDMQMPNMDPEVMRQMMDSPFMQNIMGNTGEIVAADSELFIVVADTLEYRFRTFHHHEQSTDEGVGRAESRAGSRN
ncbi:hypothetical protein MBANPS3_007688 [Mucor bainieri]